MAKYILQSSAVVVADYATDEHPYDKDPAKPETFSEYNQGWNDACDYIRDKIEMLPSVEAEPHRETGHWFPFGKHSVFCDCCNSAFESWFEEFDFCPICGAAMQKGEENG